MNQLLNRVTRNENDHCTEIHTVFKKSKNSNGNLDTSRVFHGTHGDWLKPICYIGLKRSACERSKVARGVNVSNELFTSLAYAQPDSEGNQFVCVLGIVKGCVRDGVEPANLIDFGSNNSNEEQLTTVNDEKNILVALKDSRLELLITLIMVMKHSRTKVTWAHVQIVK